MNNSPAERRERIEQIILRTQECGHGDGYDENGVWRRIFCDHESLSAFEGRSDNCLCRKTADAILSSDLVGMDQQRACIEGSLTPENTPLSLALSDATNDSGELK